MMTGSPQAEIIVDTEDGNNFSYLWDAIDTLETPGVISDTVLRDMEHIKVPHLPYVAPSETQERTNTTSVPAFQPRRSAGLFRGFRRLIHRRVGWPQYTLPYNNFRDNPRYQGPIVTDTSVVFASPNLPDDSTDIWAFSAPATSPPDDNNVGIEPACIAPRVNAEPAPEIYTREGRFLKLGSFLAGLHERIKHKRVAMAMGALVAVSSLTFIATNFDKEPTQAPNSDVTARAIPRVNNNTFVFSMPTDSSKTIRLIPTPSTQTIEVPTMSESLQVPVSDPENISFIIAEGGNLTWAVKDGLHEMGNADVGAVDRVVAAFQARAQSDLNVTFAGNSFEMRADELAAITASGG